MATFSFPTAKKPPHCRIDEGSLKGQLRRQTTPHLRSISTRQDGCLNGMHNGSKTKNTSLQFTFMGLIDGNALNKSRV